MRRTFPLPAEAPMPDLRRGAALQAAAALLWLPQAALLAFAVGGIAAGQGAADMLMPAAAVAGIGILRALLEAAGSRLAFRTARQRLSALRANALEALARRSPLDAARAPSGLAASVLVEQAEAVVPHLARFQPARWRAAVVPPVILAAVLPLSWTAALILAVAAPLIPLFMALVGWRAKAVSAAQLAELGSLNGALLDRLRGLSTIRTLGAVDATARRLRAEAESLRRRTMAVLRIAFLSSAVLELFAALGVAMVAVYVGFSLLGVLDFGHWGRPLDLAGGLFILLLAPAFFEPLRDLAAAWHDRAAGEAALAALAALGAPGPMIQGSDAGVAPAPAGAPAVRLENVRLRHPGQAEPVFDGLSLHIAAGEHVALLAPSGGGKSSLLALLAGLAVADAGRILIGGEALTAESAPRLRARMAHIAQRPHIFAGTLAGNVRLGRPAMDLKAARRALGAARLDAVAAARGSAPIGEGGHGLSGGEALRLAVARLAAAPQAGLILADEPTAHLDGATAREVADALFRLARGRTLILATHDPALAARADRIIRLAPGLKEAAA